MKLLLLPRDFARFLWGFANPRLKAGRIPYGRVVIVVQLIGALIFLGYTLEKKGIRLPVLSGTPYEVEVVFPDAKGLDELDEPGAAVAGSPVGRVTDVRYSHGTAIATLTLDADIRGKIFADATAAIRPASALQNLLVNIDAGDPATGPLPDGEPIPAERTETFVAIDEVTSALDSDTQAYAQILIREAERALRGREPELRNALKQVGELADTATPVSRALAERRVLLRKLVDHLDVVFTTLGRRGSELAETIDAGSQTLAVTSGREAELASATRLLAPTLAQAQLALAAGRRLAEPLVPALDRIIPVAGTLQDTSVNLRQLIPEADRFVGLTDKLIRRGARPIRLLLHGTEGLNHKLIGLIPTIKDLSKRAELLDKYKEGVNQFADLWSGGLSVNDSGGALAQIDNVVAEAPLPENFGMAAAAARSRNGEPSELSVGLAKAFERTCRAGSAAACLLRFNVPGLPLDPVSGGGG